MTKQDLVLITGCGTGIGHALALAFHAKGRRVCATARRLDAMADLAAQGILTRTLDVTDAAAVGGLLAALDAEGFQVDTLVNNAGYGAMGPLLDVPQQEWQRQFEVNLFAPMALVRATAPGMVARRRGTVVNISSVSGVMATPFAGPYCASKAALNAASDALRMELAPFGIRVVTVQPGGIQSTFGNNSAAQVSLAADSPYQPVRDGVLARANESQSDAMPAQLFAQRLVEQIDAADAPSLVRLGPKSTAMPLLKRLLPTRVLDGILMRRFRLDHLR